NCATALPELSLNVAQYFDSVYLNWGICSRSSLSHIRLVWLALTSFSVDTMMSFANSRFYRIDLDCGARSQIAGCHHRTNPGHFTGKSGPAMLPRNRRHAKDGRRISGEAIRFEMRSAVNIGHISPNDL